MLSISHGFLFIHIPKTAGNSIQQVLLPFSEDDVVLTAPFHDGLNRFEIRSPRLKIHKHSTLADYRAQLPVEQFDGLFKFHGVRNPWDRCISFFFSPHRGPIEWSEKTFERFVVENIVPSDAFLRLDDDDVDPFAHADAVVRFENLAEDFDAVCDRIGLDRPVLPRANASVHGDYRTYYRTSRSIQLVAEIFAPEIEAFGYDFDPY